MKQRALELTGLIVLSLATGCDDGGQGLAQNAGSLDPSCFADSGLIVDSAPPLLTPQVDNLWPPNHKFHSFGVEDCVELRDSCEPDLQAEFIWGSSDEPVDDLGDGHFAPDILFAGCQRVQLRSERQGPKDGRIYKLGVRVVDRAGNVAESQCTIIVDHDQRGVLGADSGESYRVLPTDSQGVLCDGIPDTLPPQTPPLPPRVDAGAPTIVDAGFAPIGI